MNLKRLKDFVRLKKHPTKEVVDLPENFYDDEKHKWRPLRFTGFVLGVLALGLGVFPIVSDQWIVGEDYSQGLWSDCYTNFTYWGTSNFSKWCETADGGKTYWQTLVMGFMIFAMAFGLLALVLSVFGMCSAKLTRKLYYFHSAGEIFFVSALAISGALLLFPMVIELKWKPENSVYTYSYAYMLEWCSAFLYFLAALCMSLDEITRCCLTATCRGKPCCANKERKESNRV